MALRSLLKTNTEYKDEGISVPINHPLNKLLQIASNQEKNWEEKAIDILKGNPLITRMPEKYHHTNFSLYGMDEIILDPEIYLWINIITHPRLKSLMKFMAIFHTSFDEKYFPVDIIKITTFLELTNYYANKLSNTVSHYPDLNLKYFQDHFERRLLNCIHILMVIYRRANESIQPSKKYLKQLCDSITNLLPLVSKEVLQRYDIKVDEGDWGRERMSTLERAIETKNIDLVRILLEKGHITHLGQPINTGNWDFSPHNPDDYTVFQMTELKCDTLNSKQLILLLAHYDSGDVLTLANNLPDSIHAKNFLIEYGKQQKEMTQAVHSGVNNQLPQPILLLVTNYTGFFQRANLSNLKRLSVNTVDSKSDYIQLYETLTQPHETSQQVDISNNTDTSESENENSLKCVIQ